MAPIDLFNERLSLTFNLQKIALFESTVKQGLPVRLWTGCTPNTWGCHLPVLSLVKAVSFVVSSASGGFHGPSV